jgi:hypothetical protein
VEWRGGNDLWSRIANGANTTRYHILDHGDLNNYAPRLAIAWDPAGKGKTSIRTGFGIFYDFLPSQLYGGAHFTPPIFMIISATPTNGVTPFYTFGNPASKNNYNGRGVPYGFPYPASVVNALGLDSKNGSVFLPAGITWIDQFEKLLHPKLALRNSAGAHADDVDRSELRRQCRPKAVFEVQRQSVFGRLAATQQSGKNHVHQLELREHQLWPGQPYLEL